MFNIKNPIKQQNNSENRLDLVQ